jgi:predicted Co/Zn/Cd cation transporter (cation efflux family)
VILLLLIFRLTFQKSVHRELWSSVALGIVLTAMFAVIRGGHEHLLTWASVVVVSVVTTAVVTRFGLLAGVVMTFVRAMLLFPITADPHGWFFESGLAAVAVVAGLAAAGLLLAGPPRRTFVRAVGQWK